MKLVEEEHIGGDLHRFPACFGKDNKHVFLISGTHVIGFDVYTGKRICLLKHGTQVVGVTWKNDKLCTFTKNSEIYHWSYNLKTYVLESQVSIHTEFDELSHVYQVGEKIFLVVLLIGKIYAEHEHRVYSLTNLDDPKPNMMAILPDIVKNRGLFDVSDEFAVFATQKKIHLLPYKKSKMEENSLLYEFHHKHFQRVVNSNLLCYDGVQIVGDSLFASMNIGRIYIWHNIKEGFSKKRPPIFVHVHSNAITFAISNHQTMFCGSGDCKITKWHTKTSGAGRWQYPQQLDGLDVPVRLLSISEDSTLLLSVLDDNSLLIAQTSTMTVVSRPEVLLWPMDVQQHWLGLYMDPSRPEYLLTSGRLGLIQWIDPVRWLTIGMLDVTEENLKVRDNLLYEEKEIWSNVYLILLTQNSIVTCECHREDLQLDRNKTLIKFFHRLTPGSVKDFKLEDIMVHEDRVLFLQSSHDEILSSSKLESEEVLRIDELGITSVLVRDERRSGRRRADLHRSLQWQDSLVISCSRIREGTFATINTLQSYSYVLIWDLASLNVLDYIDSLNGVKQVQWAPIKQIASSEDTSHILLITCLDCVAAYDLHLGSITWIVPQSNLKIYANTFMCYVYNMKHITLFDCQTGQPKQRFSSSKKLTQVIATGDENNLRFSGLTDEDKLILLKESNDTNSTFQQAAQVTKKTPFSSLIEKAKTAAKEKSERIQPVHSPSVKKLLDGPVYALAPITQLAPAFVKSCLIKSSN